MFYDGKAGSYNRRWRQLDEKITSSVFVHIKAKTSRPTLRMDEVDVLDITRITLSIFITRFLNPRTRRA